VIAPPLDLVLYLVQPYERVDNPRGALQSTYASAQATLCEAVACLRTACWTAVLTFREFETLSGDDDGFTDSMFGNRSREITVEPPATEAHLREAFGSVLPTSKPACFTLFKV
jgi:hypothetical protein